MDYLQTKIYYKSMLRYTGYMKKRWVTIGAIGLVLLLVTAGVLVWIFRDTIFRSQLVQPVEPGSQTQQSERQGIWSEVSVVASTLDTPWSLAFLPGGDILVTERNGQVQRIGAEGTTYEVSGVQETGEGGLLGMALHPDFTTNNYVYLYLTTAQDGGLTNRVERYTLQNDTLSGQTTILAGIPAASNHNGGGIAFGPDAKLYVTTGDAAQPELAQDTGSLAGKILRLNDDGSALSDNPFNNLVWSYGHRNPQGITWDADKRLWSVEHGPSGERKGRGKDELNLVERGANYGWPVIAGDETADGMRSPVAHSSESNTWAPSGIAYYDGSLFFAGLRGQTLYEARIENDDSVTLTEHFNGTYGRLRAVGVHDNQLYFTSSNRDGRGKPLQDDDRIYRFSFL